MNVRLEFANPLAWKNYDYIEENILLTKLLLLFILVPALELILLIQIGQWVGILPTLGLIIFTGTIGAFLARQQGMQVLVRLRTETQAGRLPTETLFDGALVLVAGGLLMTPGILTDTVGFLCLIPATRRFIRRIVWSRLEQALRSGQIMTTAYTQHPPSTYPEDDVVIIDHDDLKS